MVCDLTDLKCLEDYSFIVPSSIMIVIYIIFLVRAHRGSDFAYVKVIGWLMLICNVAMVASVRTFKLAYN
jgi:hypothetical protein